MLRFILVVILWVMLVIGGIAVVLYHLFGLKGLLAFPLVMIVLLWVLKKVMGRVFKQLLQIPFRLKGGVLDKAKMEVHSITPVTVLRRMDEIETGEDEELKHYYDVDVTIHPRGNSPNRIWEPGELILTSAPAKRLEDLVEKEVGSIHDSRVWDGAEFGPDDPGKYAGKQRLKLTFGVKPGTAKAWLQYYTTTIGAIELPVWNL
jgi:hypothetical protein